MKLSDYIESYPGAKTQSEWALEFGMSQPFFSQVLSGQRRPGFDTMVRIERTTRGAVPVSSWAAPMQEDAPAVELRDAG
jgi:DNA-binding transcriptional regulator YdaS (Cro superfamily)